jgi:hypothetical protein
MLVGGGRAVELVLVVAVQPVLADVVLSAGSMLTTFTVPTHNSSNKVF